MTRDRIRCRISCCVAFVGSLQVSTGCFDIEFGLLSRVLSKLNRVRAPGENEQWLFMVFPVVALATSTEGLFNALEVCRRTTNCNVLRTLRNDDTIERPFRGDNLLNRQNLSERLNDPKKSYRDRKH